MNDTMSRGPEAAGPTLRPRLVRFEVTGRCSMSCKHCYVTRDTRKTADMELERVKAVLDRIAVPGQRILFLGGDPFERSDMVEIVRHAKARGAIVGVDTNAWLLDPETIATLAEAGLDKLNVTVYGTDPASHDAFTRRGHFERIVENLREAREAGIACDLAFMLSRQNFLELFRLRGFGRRMGVKDIHLDVYLSTDNEARDRMFELTPAQFAAFWGLLRPFLLGFLASTGEKTATPIKVSLCEKHAVPLVKPDGQVWPCLFYPRSFTNIFDEDIDAVWRKFASFSYDREVCTSCILKKTTSPVRRALALAPKGGVIQLHAFYNKVMGRLG